jgi:hypothetical protein
MITDLEAQRAIDKLHRQGFDLLSDRDKTIATVWLFEGQVENGGFEHFFSHAAGEIAFHAPEALQRIGAVQMAEIASRANSAFGAGGPPRDRETRKARVEAFTEAAKEALRSLENSFFDCPEDVDELLEQHLLATSAKEVTG